MSENVPFLMRASAGKISGISRYRRFGVNPDVDAGTTPEDIWANSGTYTFQSSAATLSVTSSSASDTSSGTGMQVLRLTGLDQNYDLQQEDVTLTGSVAVVTAGKFIRVLSCFGISSGTAQGNVGNITISNGSTTVGFIQIGAGQTQQVVGTVPRNHSWLVDTFRFSIDKASNAICEIDLQLKIFGTNTWRTLNTIGITSDGTSEIQLKTGHGDYTVLPEKADYRARVRSATGTNISVTCNIGGYLIDNNKFFF